MCRIAAYLGPSISLNQFLIEPAHSLYRQSWDARELTETKISADGFALVWQQDQDLLRDVNTQPIWQDGNLSALGQSLHSSVWLGNVRSATPGLGMGPDNTSPFVHDDMAFTHNGRIANFADTTRRAILDFLKPQFEKGIQGNTDSEYLFAIYRQVSDNLRGMEAALAFAETCRKLLLGHDALLNTLLVQATSTGSQLIAIRDSLGALTSPSLYYRLHEVDYMDGQPRTQTIASEPFDDSPDWVSFGAHQIIQFSTVAAPIIEDL